MTEQMKDQLLAYQMQFVDFMNEHITEDGVHATPIPSLTFVRASKVPDEPYHSVYSPSLCFIAQGAKTATLTNEVYRYDPFSYLVTSVHLPISGNIIEADPERPFLSLHLNFSIEDILDLVKENLPTSNMEPDRGIFVNQLSPQLLDALLRLLRLLDTPQDISALAPLFTREIVYWMLQGEHSEQIKQFAIIGSQAHTIIKAIQRINRDFAKALRIEELAKEVNMSVPSFHKHFKKVTNMSPLQYQKTIKLQEARRMLFSQNLKAADIAFEVGYESPSQFSREYTRLFGLPPKKDVNQKRNAIAFASQ